MKVGYTLPADPGAPFAPFLMIPADEPSSRSGCFGAIFRRLTPEFRRRRAPPRRAVSPQACRRAGACNDWFGPPPGVATDGTPGSRTPTAGTHSGGGGGPLGPGGHLPACAAAGAGGTTGPTVRVPSG